MSGWQLIAAAVITAVGLTAGNFVWAAVYSHDYAAAADRSFFQAAALLAFCWHINDQVRP